MGKDLRAILKYNQKKEFSHILGKKGKKLKDIANEGNGTIPKEFYLYLIKIGSHINFTLLFAI